MLELAAAVTRALPRDISSDRAQHLITSGEELGALLRQALLASGSQPAALPLGITKYDVEVDYGLTVAKAVKAGRYDYVNPNITAQNFPAKRSDKAATTVELVHFDKYMPSDEAKAELDGMGLRPAELHELLVLGTTHPKLQRKFPIIALGSVWQGPDGSRSVTFLDGYGSERYLYLSQVDSDWFEHCRFAAVRK
jgi:hypothetical protein